jgi:signal transduction histidine kinase
VSVSETDCCDDTRTPTGVVVGIVAAVAVLVGLQLVGSISSESSVGLIALDVSVGFASLALVPLLVRRPFLAGLLLGGLAAVSPAATPVATLAAFQVARVRPIREAVWVAVVGVVAHLVLGLWRPIEGLPYGWYVVLVLIAYATLTGWGAYSRARQALLRSLEARAVRAETEQAARVAEARQHERARLAREMHDVLAHRLSLLATYAGALEYRPDASPDRIAQAAGVVRAGISEALQELRDVIALLREDDEPDQTSSLRPLPTLLDLPRLVEECETAGMQIAVQADSDGADMVPPAIGRAAYRVVQEGLTNARKHAPGQPVTVTIARPLPREVVVEVCNTVSGADLALGSGYGLVGLTERVTLLGGNLRHGRTDGEFRLRADFEWSR